MMCFYKFFKILLLASEKLAIMKDKDSRSINKRTELMNKCRHKWRQKLAGNRKLWTFWHNKNQVFRGYKAYAEGLKPIAEIVSISHHLIHSYMLPE